MQGVSSLLASLVGRLREDTSSTLLLAAEIEFYLCLSDDNESVLLAALEQACASLPLFVGEVEKERGAGQYEIQLAPTNSPLLLAETINAARQVISDTAALHRAEAIFASKPYPKEPGSSIHIHLNLFSPDGVNRFQKEAGEDPAILLHAIGGLCATMPEILWICAPEEAAYLRFVKNSNAPTTVSWGANNRTTALRIPLSSPENRRIEHRLAGAEADPGLLIAAILAGVHYGITQAITPPDKIYGDASHPQYALPTLPASLDAAQAAYIKGGVIKAYIG